VLTFPSSFRSSWDASRALHHLALWSGGRGSTVWIPQFASLRNHVREISRTPSGSRVKRLSRQMSVWSESVELAASLHPRDAALLYGAALQEAQALLELGYPRSEGLSFVTRIPPPGENTRRTPRQMQAALHHLGGDFDLFRTMLRSADSFDPRLKAVFSVWPEESYDESREQLRVTYPGQTVPAVVSISRELRGYALLVLYDLAVRLRTADGIGLSVSGFEEFVTEDDPAEAD
jgi:hypothetical protein